MPNYITNDDTIIYDYTYNEEPDINLISNYCKLIFSDYELGDDLFVKYENNNLNNSTYLGSKFNQPISNICEVITCEV